MSINRRIADFPFGKDTKAPALPIEGDMLSNAMIAAGAIVDYGTNENGSYWRWENGLQLCFDIRNTENGPYIPMGSIFWTGSNLWTFPASFVTRPVVLVSEVLGVGACWGGLGTGATNESATTFAIFRSEAISLYIPAASLVAIGRWK